MFHIFKLITPIMKFVMQKFIIKIIKKIIFILIDKNSLDGKINI